jgi:hypothetical protein
MPNPPVSRARRSPWRLAILAPVLMLWGSSLTAQTAPPPAPLPAKLTLDAAMRTEILDRLCEQVLANYVEADTAKMIADQVRARAKSGAYDAITDPMKFSEAVTADMRKVNGDLHLGLRYDPAGSSPLAGAMGTRRIVKEGGDGPTVVRRVMPGGPAPGGGPPPGFMRQALEQNFGLTRVEVLPGNVGYLEISGFMGVEGYEQAVGDALRLLERTDAIIVDVRRNGGGNGEMSHLVFSHFLPAEPVETIRVKSRDPEMSRLQKSVAEVPGPRRPDVPLYVLTSRSTGSAAEEFSFVLKNLKRATLVGDRTAGAGHMVNGYPLPHGFVAGVSITRVSDPRTGAEWEGIGVQPDQRVPAEQALGVAHGMALRAAAARAETEERRLTLERTAEWVEARDWPAPLSPALLTAIAGTYEGDRRVEVVNGRPFFSLAGRIPEELVPVGNGSFALRATRISFASGSPSPSVNVDRPDGTKGSYARVSSASVLEPVKN